MSSEIITAVLSGFITALVIEIYRQINERKKTLEIRQLEHNKKLHTFLEYDETLHKVRPVARLLISSHSKQMRTRKAPKGSCLIKNIREIRGNHEPFNEIIQDEINVEKGKPPRKFFSIPRTFHRVIFKRLNYIQVWTIRKRIDLLGTVTAIGRSKNSDIQLNSNLVSRLHSIIRYENGLFVFYNLSTSSDILINDREITFQKILQDGDVIEFAGSHLIEFEQKDPAPQKAGYR